MEVEHDVRKGFDTKIYQGRRDNEGSAMSNRVCPRLIPVLSRTPRTYCMILISHVFQHYLDLSTPAGFLWSININSLQMMKATFTSPVSRLSKP